MSAGRDGRVENSEAVEMGELRADAAEIVPHAAEDLLDLRRRFLRKRGGQIGAADCDAPAATGRLAA